MSFRYRTFPAFATILVIAAFAGPQPARAIGVRETPKIPDASQLPERKSVEIIDINRASADDFAKLPGIGPELARRIVAFREKHGPFRRVEDLLVIRGVGHKKWRAIRPYLRVGNEAEKKQR